MFVQSEVVFLEGTERGDPLLCHCQCTAVMTRPLASKRLLSYRRSITVGAEHNRIHRWLRKCLMGKELNCSGGWRIGDPCLTIGLQARALSQSMRVFTPR